MTPSPEFAVQLEGSLVVVPTAAPVASVSPVAPVAPATVVPPLVSPAETIATPPSPLQLPPPVRIMGTEAVVTQVSTCKPPIMEAGEFTPRNLRNWYIASRAFCNYREIADDERARKVAHGMKDPRAVHWLDRVDADLRNMTLEEYYEALKEQFLPASWESDTRLQLMALKQEGKETKDWIEEMEDINSLLAGTRSHLADEQFRFNAESNMTPDLRTAYQNALLHDEPDRRTIPCICWTGRYAKTSSALTLRCSVQSRGA